MLLVGAAEAAAAAGCFDARCCLHGASSEVTASCHSQLQQHAHCTESLHPPPLLPQASKNLRRGKGKMRNRRYVQRKGPLVVYGNDAGIRCARIGGFALHPSFFEGWVTPVVPRRPGDDCLGVGRAFSSVGAAYCALPCCCSLCCPRAMLNVAPALPATSAAAARPSATCPAWRLPPWTA